MPRHDKPHPHAGQRVTIGAGFFAGSTPEVVDWYDRVTNGAFSELDIRGCIEAVLFRSAQLVVAAASDRPWALRLGFARDLVSFCVLAAFVVYAWGTLS